MFLVLPSEDSSHVAALYSYPLAHTSPDGVSDEEKKNTCEQGH